MEKQIIKIYSETGKVPEYKTSGASGFECFIATLSFYALFLRRFLR